MRRFSKLALCLAGGVLLAAGLRAQDVAMSGNPYMPIVMRNVFGLLPPPPPPDPNAVDPKTLPKITPNGIMTILGQLQVIFKVSGGIKEGKAAPEQSYMLAEGEGQDDIEVVKINEQDETVTFKNHGVVQEIPLVTASSASSAPAVADNSANTGNNPGAQFGGHGGNPGGGAGVMNAGGRNPLGGSNPNPGANNNPGNNPSPQPTPSAGGGYSTQKATMSPDEQIIMIEAERQELQNEGNPDAKILPFTPVTPGAGNADGGDTSAPGSDTPAP